MIFILDIIDKKFTTSYRNDRYAIVHIGDRYQFHVETVQEGAGYRATARDYGAPIFWNTTPRMPVTCYGDEIIQLLIDLANAVNSNEVNATDDYDRKRTYGNETKHPRQASLYPTHKP